MAADMTAIHRVDPGPRLSQMVIHGNLVWLAGQCGTAHKSIADQTAEALAKIDRLLARAGSDKTRLLNTTIWLSDIADYDAMNAVWDSWIPAGCAPARACAEARLGGIGYGVEIICLAAKSEPGERAQA